MIITFHRCYYCDKFNHIVCTPLDKSATYNNSLIILLKADRQQFRVVYVNGRHVKLDTYTDAMS